MQTLMSNCVALMPVDATGSQMPGNSHVNDLEAANQ